MNNYAIITTMMVLVGFTLPSAYGYIDPENWKENPELVDMIEQANEI